MREQDEHNLKTKSGENATHVAWKAPEPLEPSPPRDWQFFPREIASFLFRFAQPKRGCYLTSQFFSLLTVVCHSLLKTVLPYPRLDNHT